MNTDTQKPSEHAIRAAADYLRSLHYEENHAHVYELAHHIDQHAIAPAVAEATAKLEQELNTAHAVGSSYAKELAEARREVAERDKRIAELVDALEIIAGKRQCVDVLMGNDDIALAALAKHGGSHE